MAAPITPFSRWDRYEQSPATSEPASEFGVVVRRIRERTRLSQSALADRCEVDHSYISRLEAGARMPSRPTVDRIARELPASESEHRDLLRAAGFHPSGPTEPLLDELAALLADPATPDWTRQAVRGGLWTVREMARRATAGELDR